MSEEFKAKLVENLQWLGGQIGKEVEIIDRLSCNKGNYDRHFTSISQYTFVVKRFTIAISGGIGCIEGEKAQFQFKTGFIKRIEKAGNELEIELDLDQRTSRLINFKIKELGMNKL